MCSRETAESRPDLPCMVVRAVSEPSLMDEESFRAFYDRTVRPLWAYLSRVSGNSQLADDLVQEAYYRFLRASFSPLNEAHARNYLYRIATNLLRDNHRRRKPNHLPLEDMPSSESTADTTQRRWDLNGALDDLKPRERELLWLAYVEGSSHQEIAERTGLKAASIRQLLFRARQKLANLLRQTIRGKR